MRLLIVLGEGGHTTEILRLLDLMGPDYDYHYLAVEEDALSPQQIRIKGPVYRVRRPRSKDESVFRTIPRLALNIWQAVRVIRAVRPQAIISFGPAIAVPVSALGKLAGAKVIHVETASRVHRLSLTGRMMYRLADLFFVQWPELQAHYPRAIYAGRLV